MFCKKKNSNPGSSVSGQTVKQAVPQTRLTQDLKHFTFSPSVHRQGLYMLDEKVKKVHECDIQAVIHFYTQMRSLCINCVCMVQHCTDIMSITVANLTDGIRVDQASQGSVYDVIRMVTKATFWAPLAVIAIGILRQSSELAAE